MYCLLGEWTLYSGLAKFNIWEYYKNHARHDLKKKNKFMRDKILIFHLKSCVMSVTKLTSARN